MRRGFWWEVLGFVLIRGERWETVKAGRVANFCPIDRGLEAGLISLTLKREHVHFVPIEAPQGVGLQVVCETCNSFWLTPPDQYGEPSQDEAASPEELLAAATPEHQHAVRSRMELERRALQGGLSPQRTTLLAEPFPTVLLHASKVSRRGEILAYVMIVLTLIVSVFIIATTVRGRLWVLIPLAFYLLLTLGPAYLALKQRRRMLDNEILPRLVKALAPLQPTHQELADTVERMRHEGFKAAKWIRVDELYDRLAKSTFRV